MRAVPGRSAEVDELLLLATVVSLLLSLAHHAAVRHDAHQDDDAHRCTEKPTSGEDEDVMHVADV